MLLCGYNNNYSNKVDVLHVRLTELHAAHQNLPPAIRTLHLKETIQNIHQKRTKSDNMIHTWALCHTWHEFFNKSNLFMTYFQCLMGFDRASDWTVVWIVVCGACWLFSLTESPDIVKCLTNIAKLCFPDNGHDLLAHDDGRCATSPLSLIVMFQRLQHLISGGSMLALCCLSFAVTVVYLQLNEHHLNAK